MYTKKLLIFFLFPILLYSQNENIIFNRVNIEPVYAQNIITAIINDSKGLLWIGTPYGLYSYNGYEFTLFVKGFDTASISNNYIRQIFEDSDGNLWVGTIRGLNKFDRKRNKFIRDTLPGKVFSSTERDLYIQSINEDNFGNLIVTTKSNIYYYDKKLNKFRIDSSYNYSLHNIINRDYYILGIGFSYFDKSKKHWFISSNNIAIFSSRDHSIFNPNLESPVIYNVIFKSKTGVDLKTIKCFLTDSKGNIWFGTTENVLLKFQESEFINKRIKPKIYKIDFTKQNHQQKNVINTIYEDKHGTIYVGTENGLAVYNEENDNFFLYQSDASNNRSISNNKVSVIYEDKGGNIWVGTKGGGLNKFRNDEIIFRNHEIADSTKKKRGNPVSCFAEYNNHFYVGTLNGILEYSEKTDKFQTIIPFKNKIGNEISGNLIRSFFADTNRGLFVGTNYGLYLFKNGKFNPCFQETIKSKEKRINHAIMSIIPLNDNYLFYFSQQFIEKLDLNSKEIKCFSTLVDKSRYTLKNSYINYDNSFLITTNGYVLKIFDLKNEKFSDWSISINDSIKGKNGIQDFKRDLNGEIWIGTNNGMSKLIYSEHANPNNPQNFLNKNNWRLEDYYLNDVLDMQSIYAIESDNVGNLWFSTDDLGIWKFNPRTKLLRGYSEKDGLKAVRFFQGKSYKNEKGEIFFASLNGYISFNPNTSLDTNYVAPIIFTSISQIGKELEFDVPLNDIKEIELPYYKNYITFEYAFLDFIEPKNNIYEYMLEGLNKEWINVRNLRRLNFSNLDGGEYVFKVRAANTFNKWNTKGISIKLKVGTPPWKTTWAMIFYFLFVTSIVYFIIRYQINKNKAKLKQVQENAKLFIDLQEKIKTKVSLDLHDSVNQILFSTKLKNKVPEKISPENVINNVNEVNSLIDNAMTEVRRISHELHPIVLEEFGLIDAISSYCRQFSKRSEIDVRLIKDSFPEAISKDLQINLYRIIQEALTNVEKHSDATIVIITFGCKESNLLLTIKDNGKGFDKQQLLNKPPDKISFGLKNMQERISYFNGKYQITSGIGDGTIIKIIIPL